MKRLLLVFLFFFLLAPNSVFAQSEYVLPYPSSMPGTISYKFHLFFEKIQKYWYFGDFGQFDYNLKQSDKYLVEAKVLFEYKQYLLAYKALNKSDDYFANIKGFLLKSKINNKNTDERQKILKEAALKHIEQLEIIKSNAPKSFIWSPEKSSPTTLDIENEINKAITVRKASL